MNYADNEYLLTGFEIDQYDEWLEETGLVKWAKRKKYLKKMKFYKMADVFHGSYHIAAVKLLTWLWDNLPLESPYGHIDEEDLSEIFGCDLGDLLYVVSVYRRYGMLKLYSDGVYEVRYKYIL